jgi:hypothetical protein
MNPEGQIKKPTLFSNLYTVILAAAFCIMFATAAYVAYKCFIQYDTLFKIP